MQVKSKKIAPSPGFEAERLGNITQFGTEMCYLIVVQLVEVKELIRQWDPSKSRDRQETPAPIVVLFFDTEVLKAYKELGKYFSKNCEISRESMLLSLEDVGDTEGGQRHRSTYSQESSIEIRAPRPGKAFISSYLQILQIHNSGLPSLRDFRHISLLHPAALPRATKLLTPTP